MVDWQCVQIAPISTEGQQVQVASISTADQRMALISTVD